MTPQNGPQALQDLSKRVEEIAKTVAAQGKLLAALPSDINDSPHKIAALTSKVTALEATVSTPSPAVADLSKQFEEVTKKVATLQAALVSTSPELKTLYDTARATYGEYGNQIRHFSTIRSAVTTFLVTAGMTALAGYLDKKFISLLYAGAVFGVAAIAVCLRFSYLTEKHVVLYKDMWHLLNRQKATAKLDNLDWEVDKGIWKRVCCDAMNWLLVGAALAFLLYVRWTFLHRGVAAPVILSPDVWPDDLQ